MDALSDFWIEPADFPLWRKRLELEREARNLTLHRQLALRTLLSFVGDEGLYPSDEAIAKLCKLSARTVRRARADARELGLLSWRRTRKLVNGRSRQGSNVYAIAIPDRPVCPGGQAGRRRKEVRKKEANKPAPTLSSADIERLRDIRIAASLQSERVSRMLGRANCANRSKLAWPSRPLSPITEPTDTLRGRDAFT